MSDLVTRRLALYSEEIRKELAVWAQSHSVPKDILIVVRNGLSFLKNCIDSVRQNTTDYTLYVWDNGSDPETANWLNSQPDLRLNRSEENNGFLIPNNRLAALGSSPFLVLLNSDTEVQMGWDTALTGFVQQGYAQVGFAGGLLDAEGKGTSFTFGGDVDYIPGWCFCISRPVYERFGLFDEQNLEFAYCEDADFSLRLTEAGEKIYALHLDLVKHLENRTILQVRHERDCEGPFKRNHQYIRHRWSHRLRCK